MKKLLLLLLFIPVVSCSDATIPYADIYNSGEIKIYVDNSNIKEFDLEMVYGNYIDTIRSDIYKPKIVKFDTLFFKITESGVDKYERQIAERVAMADSLDRKLIRLIDKAGSQKEKLFKDGDLEVSELTQQYRKLSNFIDKKERERETVQLRLEAENNFIRVYPYNNVKITIKKDNKVLESYTTNIEEAIYPSKLRSSNKELATKHWNVFDYKRDGIVNNQYIINPLSLSTYVIDTIQYSDWNIYGFEGYKSKIISKNFNSVNLIDWWFGNPPDSLKLNEIQSAIGVKTFSIKRVK